MQFANKTEKPYQTKILEWWVEMRESSRTASKNWTLLRACAFHFIYIFIKIFAKFGSSYTMFTRDILPCT